MKYIHYACMIGLIGTSLINLYGTMDTNQESIASAMCDPINLQIINNIAYDENTVRSITKDSSDLIPCDTIKEHAKKFITRNLPAKTASSDRTIIQAHNDAHGIMEKICTMLTTHAKSRNISCISTSIIENFLKSALAPVINRVARLHGPTQKLFDCVTERIDEFFRISKSSKAPIPAEMKEEFAHRKTTLILALKSRMQKYKTDQISIQDIDAAVKDSFGDFIQRMDHVHRWQWINAEIANLHTDDSSKTASSYLKPNPESKKLRERMRQS